MLLKNGSHQLQHVKILNGAPKNVPWNFMQTLYEHMKLLHVQCIVALAGGGSNVDTLLVEERLFLSSLFPSSPL